MIGLTRVVVRCVSSNLQFTLLVWPGRLLAGEVCCSIYASPSKLTSSVVKAGTCFLANLLGGDSSATESRFSKSPISAEKLVVCCRKC